MTPDTAALRALANGVSRLGAPQEFTSEEDFAGLGMGRAERRYYAAVTPDAVRALCDAADEVERLRANGNGYLQRAHAAEAVVERLRCVHCGEVGCDWIGDIRKARAEMAEAERDAARDEVERLRADRDALREQVQRLRASRESNRGGWARTLVERDALRAAVDRVRALGERDGRDRLAAWLASNGVEQADTVAVEAAAFVLAALESGNYGTPEWFSSIDKPLFPLEAESSCPACERDDAADEVERLREDVEALHGLLSAGAIGTAPGSDSHRMVLAMRDHYKRQRDAARDEVERLRAAVVERDTRLAETIRYHDARVNRADEATDASRTAHAALVADLRALHVREVAQRQTGHGDNAEGIWLCAECLTEYPCRTAALLDRHAPTTGETP